MFHTLLNLGRGAYIVLAASCLPLVVFAEHGGAARSLGLRPGHGIATAGSEEPKGPLSYIVSGIEFKHSELIGSYRVDGLYNLVDLGNWNGQPLSETNIPADYYRRLAATISLYKDHGSNNDLYVQVQDVITGPGASWWGSAFVAITQSGVRLTLPFKNGKSLPSAPLLSSDYANPGQVLADGLTTGYEVVTPLESTPGYIVALESDNTLLIRTQQDAEYGFTNLGGIRGAKRIRGGGVFKLTFPKPFNVNQIDKSGIMVEARYGRGTQYITGTLVTSQP